VLTEEWKVAEKRRESERKEEGRQRVLPPHKNSVQKVEIPPSSFLLQSVPFSSSSESTKTGKESLGHTE